MLVLFLTWCLFAGCAGFENVVVKRLQLQHEMEYQFVVNSLEEYILDYVPNAEQSQYPSRVFIQSFGGEEHSPLVITAKYKDGADSWQLPYWYEDKLLYEVEKTLCPDQKVTVEGSDCNNNLQTFRTPNSFSLQISTSCQVNVSFVVLATPVREWVLPYQTRTSAMARPTAPATFLYNYRNDQDGVKLVLESEDDVCCIVVIQNVTCPLAKADALINVKMMSMLRSGAVHLPRQYYPNGFYVIVYVKLTDKQCTGVEAEEEPEQWLFSRLVWGEHRQNPVTPERIKELTIRVEAAITRSQYLIATLVTLAIFLAFYILFMVLIFAQRIPALKKYVAPKALLIKNDQQNGNEDENNVPQGGARTAQRRISATTFDGSDTSDVETTSQNITTVDNDVTADPSNQNGTRLNNNGNQEATPFGLPTQLRVAALSRRGARVLTARADRYLQTLYTVAIFYLLPVVQFVLLFQFILNVSGTLDLCYYNFLCAHPLGAVSDFNHVFSNLGYLLLGALFLVQVKRRRMRRKRHPVDEEYGLPAHYGLLSSLGAGMMMVAILSASYHVCPNALNFQFDTSFMYVLTVISMVKIYQSRHPDINARAHVVFSVLAGLIALVLWGVLGGSPFFWAMFTILHIAVFLLISLRIYYVGQFKLEKETIQETARQIASLPKRGMQPLYKPRLVALVIGNLANWGFAFYGLYKQGADFASHLLNVLLMNTLLHMVYYLVMKLINKERPRWYAWCYLAGAAASWAPALYFFISGSTDWSTTAAYSRQMNHECMVMDFYDAHDLWHMLSALALYLSFNAMLTWDDGLAAVKRSEIVVF